jgi:bifunctional DNase/RNase
VETAVVVECELSRIIVRDTTESQYIFLQEKTGQRRFPIIIGSYEAMEISRKIAAESTARPLTHDLIRSILDSLGARLTRVVVDDLRNSTFHAKLHLEHNGQTIPIDCRPSDAIALAVATHVPIFVEEAVLDAVCREESE